MRLEETLIQFYLELAKKDNDHSKVFESFTKENIKERESIEKVYRESITDAHSVGFLQKPLYESEYWTVLPQKNLQLRNFKILCLT